MSALENIDKVVFEGVGDYGIPKIEPVTEFTAKRFERLIYMNKVKDLYNVCLHTFSYDYQFNSVWTKPDIWTDRLSGVDSVIAPDFSLYRDMPYAIQIYNHYRKHWVARYWYEAGIKVIPNIRWSDENSYSFCFDGEPKNSIIAIGTTGTQRDKTAKELFFKGFNKAMEILTPKKVILYGALPDELKNVGIDFIHIPHHYDVRNGKADYAIG